MTLQEEIKSLKSWAFECKYKIANATTDKSRDGWKHELAKTEQQLKDALAEQETNQ
jgi:hypothetical protein